MGLELKGAVSLDGSGFEAGLKKLEGSAEHFAEALKGVALEAFGIYTVEQAFSKTLETAKELVNESKRLGVGVERLQVLKQAAKDGGTELSALAKAFEKIDIAREKALGNTEEGKKLLGRFGQLGITRENLQTQTAAQLFAGQFHEKAATMNQETIGPILRDILGKGFGDVLPVLKTDVVELQHEMEKLGGIMSTETAVSLKVFGDEMELIGTIIISQLAPVLVQLGLGLAKFLAVITSVVAGMAAFAGAATPDIKHLVKAVIDPFNIWGKLTGPKIDYAGGGKAAVSAMDENFGKWYKGIQAVENKIKEMSEGIKNPPPPKFEPNPNEEEKAQKIPKPSEDAMVRVGNFLGNTTDALQSIAERQVTLLQMIEQNTRPTFAGGSSGTSYPPG